MDELEMGSKGAKGSRRGKHMYDDGEEELGWGTTLFTRVLGAAFALFMIMLMCTGVGMMLGVQRAAEMARVKVENLRLEHIGYRNSSTCLIYFNEMSETERKKYPEAHRLDTSNCDRAKAVLAESERVQFWRTLMEHYAMCESDKCFDQLMGWVYSSSLVSAVLMVPVGVLVLVGIWLLGGGRRQNSDLDNYVITSMRMKQLERKYSNKTLKDD